MIPKMAVNGPLTFEALDAYLGERSTRILGHNTLAVRVGDAVAVRYHRTNILTYTRDGRITIRSGGYETATTKTRLNSLLPSGVRVFAQNRVWRVRFGAGAIGVDRPFVDGMVVGAAADGVWGTYALEAAV